MRNVMIVVIVWALIASGLFIMVLSTDCTTCKSLEQDLKTAVSALDSMILASTKTKRAITEKNTLLNKQLKEMLKLRNTIAKSEDVLAIAEMESLELLAALRELQDTKQDAIARLSLELEPISDIPVPKTREQLRQERRIELIAKKDAEERERLRKAAEREAKRRESVEWQILQRNKLKYGGDGRKR